MVESHNIPKPDLSDHETWATMAETHVQWLRAVAPRYGLNVEKLVLGDVLATVVGDDANCFGLRMAGFLGPELAEIGKRELLIRLDWEIATPELPERIRGRLKEAKEELETLGWETPEGFEEARDLWERRVQKFTQGEIDSHPEYLEAMRYEIWAAGVFHDEWNQFLYGEK